MLTNFGQFQDKVLSGMDQAGLPLPLREDRKYYDGNIYFALTIAHDIASHNLQEVNLTDEQLCILASTNGVNDWWMDETVRSGERDYDSVNSVWNAINYLCYSELNPDQYKRPQVSDPEIRKVLNHYQRAIDMMPPESRMVTVQHLLAINLYQGLSLIQEEGMRDHLGLPTSDVIDIETLRRMQIEKGGMMVMYAAPLIPSQFDISESLPASPPTLINNYRSFKSGKPIYPPTGIVRYAVELGSVIQVMDDVEDANRDYRRGVTSPENLLGTRPNNIIASDVITRPALELEVLRASSNASPLHSVLFTTSEAIINEIAKYRSQRTPVQDILQ